MNEPLYKPLALHSIYRARAEKSKELMEVYDREVYYPALKALRSWCVENGGHRNGTHHDNGLGWSWFYCSKCGARVGITGPDGRTGE